MGFLAIACLTATEIAVVRPPPLSPWTLTPTSRVQRSKICAQLPAGWISATDEGGQYYYNEQTGQSQWEPPAQQGYGATPDYAVTPGYGDEEVVLYIAQQLQEPQVRIVRAVVDYLGTATAYELLESTAQIQSQGGVLVPQSGRLRTSGGIFYKLLQEATHLPREAQEAAIRRIKQEGKNVKSWEKAVPHGY